MIVNYNEIYLHKMAQINNRIKSRLDSIKNRGFSAFLENKMVHLHNENSSCIAKTDKPDLNRAFIDKVIREKSEQYNTNEDLVRAVIKAESNFNPNAVSKAGAIGIMQLMPETARALNVTDPYDPIQNIDGGIRYLKNQITNYKGNVKMALAAYNCGPGRLNSLNITNINDEKQFSRLPKETQNYIKKIMRFINEKV